MGKQEIALLIPLLALAIPVAAVILNGMQWIAKLRLEEARLRGDASRAANPQGGES
jgi:hypothetical protein